MKNLIIIAFCLYFSFGVKAQQPIAVIELFTSQGCSSCPSADRLLAQTISDSKKNGQNIIALSFHVDYWNRLGWADPFSEEQYSQRQANYVEKMHLRSAYTPQMVVNGQYEFVGSNKSDLKKALEKALATKPTASFKSLKASFGNGDKLQMEYELEGDYAGCELHFALVSLHEKTSVKRGENGGKELENENVVRQFITRRANASGEIIFDKNSMPARDNLAIVAYVQHPDGRIIGGAWTKL